MICPVCPCEVTHTRAGCSALQRPPESCWAALRAVTELMSAGQGSLVTRAPWALPWPTPQGTPRLGRYELFPALPGGALLLLLLLAFGHLSETPRHAGRDCAGACGPDCPLTARGRFCWASGGP